MRVPNWKTWKGGLTRRLTEMSITAIYRRCCAVVHKAANTYTVFSVAVLCYKKRNMKWSSFHELALNSIQFRTRKCQTKRQPVQRKWLALLVTRFVNIPEMPKNTAFSRLSAIKRLFDDERCCQCGSLFLLQPQIVRRCIQLTLKIPVVKRMSQLCPRALTIIGELKLTNS